MKGDPGGVVLDGKFSLRDQLALTTFSSLVPTFLPWTNYSMRPSALASVMAEIVVHRRYNIIEMGCGVSTVLLAALISQQGEGQVIALEHDHDWATAINAILNRCQLDAYARVEFAPLELMPDHLGRNQWYSLQAASELCLQPVDVLLVDGPPSTPEGPLSRLPALPFFSSALTDRSLVVLDDIGRAGEMEVLRAWEHGTRWRFERYPELGIAMASSVSPHLHW